MTGSSLGTVGESSFSTLRTESSLFASPTLPVVREDSSLTPEGCTNEQTRTRARYDAQESIDELLS